jgi:hypothetical protein
MKKVLGTLLVLLGIGWIAGPLWGTSVRMSAGLDPEVGTLLVVLIGVASVWGGVRLWRTPRVVNAGVHTTAGDTADTSIGTRSIEEERLRADIDSLKARCQSGESGLNAPNLFDLGCTYAKLFDLTHSDSHRASALKYMSRAAELDPARAKVSAFFEEHSSVSLFSEPEFERFVE